MYFTNPVTTVLSIVTLLFLAMLLYGQKKKIHPNYPPGPPRWPIIGNMHMINTKTPHLTFLELAAKYGSVFSVRLGTLESVILCGYETVKDALINHAEEFSDRPELQVFMDISRGHGVSFCSGNNWKVMRRFTLSTLRSLGMGSRTLEDKIIEECKCLVQAMKAYKGRPFENTMILNAAVANIIVSILISHRFSYDDPKLQKLLIAVDDIFRKSGTPMALLYNAFPSLFRWLPGSHREISGSADELRSFVNETFTNQRSQLDINDESNFIDVFLVKQKEEKPNPELYFHDANLTSLIVELFGAGTETTASTLQWGLLLLMKYPEIQKTVQNEIEKVIGSREPNLVHRKQMPYTDAVIHEIQRFADLGPMTLPHCTSQDVTFKGFFIPKGTQVIPLLHSVLRDKEHFEKPDEFYPQHFLDSDGNFLKNEACIPFSADLGGRLHKVRPKGISLELHHHTELHLPATTRSQAGPHSCW
ncbi:cytochrome P450 2B19-like isoform X2 [Hyperolius riggenbachi]|uniref:cytochrome P450 2B19-like isoform X2 n=1 Tax=Hyperolius riggenbachi TaxID=752182 RepID=UPI0035A36D86